MSYIYSKNLSLCTLKRKNTITDQSSNEAKKKFKIDHTTIIEETILRIECGMASREMLNECKDRYTKYIKTKEMKEFLILMKCKKTIEDEMNLYRLVYKIEKSLLFL